MEKVCIIGFGRVGSHLYFELNRTKKFHVDYSVRNSKTKIEPSKLNNCDIVFICTGDSEIAKAVRVISGKKFELKSKYIYHVSGALNSDLLRPLERKGAYTGSFHPVQTFEARARRPAGRLRGICIAAEGCKKATAKAAEIAGALGSQAVLMDKDDKVLHHINSVFASNYLVVFLSLLEKLSNELSITYEGKKVFKNGFKKSSFLNIYRPLIEQTLRNIDSKGTIRSLTGPVERNDIATVRLHLSTLSNRVPQILPFYALMGIEAAIISLKKKSIRKKDAIKMINLITGYLFPLQSKRKKN